MRWNVKSIHLFLVMMLVGLLILIACIDPSSSETVRTIPAAASETLAATIDLTPVATSTRQPIITATNIRLIKTPDRWPPLTNTP